MALYRTYRPKTFDEVIGQEHITKTLENQIMNGHIGHAYLLQAREEQARPVSLRFCACGQLFKSYQRFAMWKMWKLLKTSKDNDINIIEMDAASNNKVDDIREIREKVKFMPVDVKYKVYIIDEVHMLTDSAFNTFKNAWRATKTCYFHFGNHRGA